VFYANQGNLGPALIPFRPVSVVVGLAREYVCPATLVFHIGVGIALDGLHGPEPGPDELASDGCWGEEYEVQRNGVAEELLDVNRTVPYVEG
jgi:hypothetical protein